MTELSIYSKELHIAKGINLYIPSIREIFECGEDKYYSAVSLLISTPFDLMVQLYDMGINFDEIEEFELFCNIFRGIKKEQLSLIMKDVTPSLFQIGINNSNGQIVLYDESHDIAIDRYVYDQITYWLRKIHGFKKNIKRPGNKAAREYMIERARIKQNRSKKKANGPYLERLIVSMVNTGDFKYNFETVKDLTIYQFNQSVRQIQKLIDYGQIMSAYYAGNIDTTKINIEKYNWLSDET